MLFGGATDPNHHFVRFNWTDASGRTLAPVPHLCIVGNPPGTYTFTLNVDDGHGGTSADSVTYTLTQSFAAKRP